MWSVVNRSLNAVFDVLLWPVQGLPPTAQAVALGLPAALVALLVFRYVSDQDGIAQAKDRIKAYLLELRLYKDDFRVSLRAQGAILRHNLTYLRHALLPMAVMIVPFILMLVQVESRFAYRSLEPGEPVLLTVTAVAPVIPVSGVAVRLALPDGLSQETPALRIDTSGEVVWRLRGERAGEHQVGIVIGDVALSKRLVVGGDGLAVSPQLYRANDWGALLYPAEAPLAPDAPARSVEVGYPRARGEFLGLSSASWAFFGASILFGFALRGVLGVTF